MAVEPLGAESTEAVKVVVALDEPPVTVPVSVKVVLAAAFTRTDLIGLANVEDVFAILPAADAGETASDPMNITEDKIVEIIEDLFFNKNVSLGF